MKKIQTQWKLSKESLRVIDNDVSDLTSRPHHTTGSIDDVTLPDRRPLSRKLSLIQTGLDRINDLNPTPLLNSHCSLSFKKNYLTISFSTL